MTMFVCGAFAGEADVVGVTVDCESARVCSFAVTVSHEDEGWEHYADRWEILNENGGEIAVRVLAHPHVDEQPFTRSLNGVKISDEITSLQIRAHDSVHGYSGKTAVVKLTSSDD